MIYVETNYAKDKHDYFITNFDGKVLIKASHIVNNLDFFNDPYQRVNVARLHKILTKYSFFEHLLQ